MGLNKTQKQIISLVIKGKNNPEIARELNYSIEGVKWNLRQCFKFYKVKNRAELIREVLLTILE